MVSINRQIFWKLLASVVIVGVLLFSSMHILSSHITKKMMMIEKPYQQTLIAYAASAEDLINAGEHEALVQLLETISKRHNSWVAILNAEQGLFSISPVPEHLKSNFGFQRKVTWPVHSFIKTTLIGLPLDKLGNSLIIELPKDMYPNSEEADLVHYVLTIYIPSAILLLLSWLMYRHLMHPIEALNRGALTLAAGNLGARIDTSISSQKNELGRVAFSFNTMATRVEQLVESHRHMLGTLSHELRTPITRLTLALQAADKTTSEPVLIERMHRDVQQMNGLVEDALTLAWLESEPDLHRVEQFDLSVLLDLICDDAAFEFQEHKLQRSYPAKCLLQDSNQRVISQCIENVLRNALKYSPKQSKVVVACELSDGYYVITIVDEGCGIPEELCEQIFTPFFRVDKTSEKSGFGLGLALSKRQIQGLGGEIKAFNNSISQGLTVRIQLPVCLLD